MGKNGNSAGYSDYGISMKTGEPITINDEYNPMPESLEECLTYFSQLSTRIKLRNTRINQHIKEIKTWN